MVVNVCLCRDLYVYYFFLVLYVATTLLSPENWLETDQSSSSTFGSCSSFRHRLVNPAVNCGRREWNGSERNGTYDQCMINMIKVWSMYGMFTDVFLPLVFCKDLVHHATKRCFNGILKCICRCVVGQEAASPTLGHSRSFFFSLMPLSLRKCLNEVPPNSDFLGACTFRPKPNLFEEKRNHHQS